MSEAVVTFRHLRDLRYCTPRVRVFCREHGIEIRDFGPGVPVSRLRATGDAFAIRAADLAEKEST